MTPDTSAYMIAGFAVILSGIGIYVFSLVLRTTKVRRQIASLDMIDEEIE